MVRIRGLSRIALVVQDLERAIAFYSHVFGFETVNRRPDAALLQAPGAAGAVHLHRTRSPRPRLTEFGFTLINPGDLDVIIAEAEQRGGRLLARCRHIPGTSAAVLTDPTGHRIVL